MAGGLIDTSAVQMPDTPVAGRAAWMLSILQTIEERGIDAIDVDQIQSRFVHRRAADDREHVIGLWATAARRLGPGRVVEVDDVSPHHMRLLVEVNPDRRFWLLVWVETAPPHLLDGWDTTPALRAGMEIREVQPGDAAALARLERDAPIVQGDKATHFDHDDDDDYFEIWPLLRAPGGIVTLQDGVVIASLQVSSIPMRIGGNTYRVDYAHRIRTHPDHLGQGLINQMTRAAYELHPFGERQDAIMACIGVGNEAMLANSWGGRPGEWPVAPCRFVFDTAELASAESLYRRYELGDVVEVLNETHENDEGFLPYTIESFRERLARAPHLYGPESIFVNEHAVLGVWEAGRAMKTVVTTPSVVSVQRRAVIADWGVRHGHDDHLEQLLRTAAAAVKARGLTHLALYTSPKTRAFDRLAKLATAQDDFHMWTPPVNLPADAADRGAYIDALAF